MSYHFSLIFFYLRIFSGQSGKFYLTHLSIFQLPFLIDVYFGYDLSHFQELPFVWLSFPPSARTVWGSIGADTDKPPRRGSPLFLIIPFPLRGLLCKLSTGSGQAPEDSNEWESLPCLPWE